MPRTSVTIAAGNKRGNKAVRVTGVSAREVEERLRAAMPRELTLATGHGELIHEPGPAWRDVRTGFERPFWVANISELFERLSYYAAFASLARYLHETLKFR